VTGFSRDPDTDHQQFLLTRAGQDLRDMRGDVCELDAVLQAMEQSRAEIVLHLAAQSLVRRSYEDPLETYATNVMGTANVLEAGATIALRARGRDRHQRQMLPKIGSGLQAIEKTSRSAAPIRTRAARLALSWFAAAYRRSFFNDPSAGAHRDGTRRQRGRRVGTGRRIG
jgi:GDP-D-mannose dehydratase